MVLVRSDWFVLTPDAFSIRQVKFSPPPHNEAYTDVNRNELPYLGIWEQLIPSQSNIDQVRPVSINLVMDPIEGSLNFAHQQHRKSECHFQAGRINEAIIGHQKAVEYLEDALRTTRSAKAKESLELQLAFHLRQKEVISIKEQQLRLQERQNNNQDEVLVESVQALPISPQELHSQILRVFEEHDSLLYFLHTSKEPNMSKSDSHVSGLLQNENANVASKKPKDNNMVIEELKLTNIELRKLVEQLYVELEVSHRKNDRLLEVLEDQRRTIQELSLRKAPLGDFVSPYGFSPLCELSPSGGIRDLPHLPPLELPQFDFDSLKITNSQSE